MLPNRKLGNIITKESVLSARVSDATSLLNKFLEKRRRIRSKAFIKVKPRKNNYDTYQEVLLRIQEDDEILKEISNYWDLFGVKLRIKDTLISPKRHSTHFELFVNITCSKEEMEALSIKY